MSSTAPHKTKALKLSKQAQGMLAKVIEMIEQDEYTPAVIQQIDSVDGFLGSVKRELLVRHLETCVVETPQDKQRMRKELLKICRLAS
jgi:DNA-binding FrmR family transcriptional regulator